MAATAMLALAGALSADAWAFPEKKVRNGRYSFEQGQTTSSGAIFFKVSGPKHDRRITELVYRNSCLTHNAPSPKIRLTREGRFARTYTHSRGTVEVTLKGRFLSAERARGRLIIDESGCKTQLRFDARRD